ncbi:hypothetical protein F5Y18DRAFT_314647 [Xylariaceae sp. FL1019]|nr:hypothetical protein F5Y18DRAFT_314647 [Xylariaceae sp. FL1019]
MGLIDIFITITILLMFAFNTQASYNIAQFSDRNCQVPLEGKKNVTTVLSGTCDSNVWNYSSVIILHEWASLAGTVTWYSEHACTKGPWDSKAYTLTKPDKNKCYDLGFEANAVYLIG